MYWWKEDGTRSLSFKLITPTYYLHHPFPVGCTHECFNAFKANHKKMTDHYLQPLKLWQMEGRWSLQGLVTSCLLIFTITQLQSKPNNWLLWPKLSHGQCKKNTNLVINKFNNVINVNKSKMATMVATPTPFTRGCFVIWPTAPRQPQPVHCWPQGADKGQGIAAWLTARSKFRWLLAIHMVDSASHMDLGSQTSEIIKT